MPVGITFTQVIEKYRNLILNTSSINTWCNANYSKNLSVFVGYNMEDSPKVSDAPFCVIVPITYERGNSNDEYRFTLEFNIGVYNRTYSNFNGNGALEWKGLYHADALTELIIGALESDISNASVDIVGYNLEDLSIYPTAIATLDVDISITNVLGGTITI